MIKMISRPQATNTQMVLTPEIKFHQDRRILASSSPNTILDFLGCTSLICKELSSPTVTGGGHRPLYMFTCVVYITKVGYHK